MIVSTLIVIAADAVAQLLVARFVLDARWPASLGGLALALLLGALVFAALGIALTGAVRSAEGSSALVNAIYLPLTFISGVFFSVEGLPGFLQAIADISPLTYLLDLIRSLVLEGDAIYDVGEDLLVLGAWGLAGLVVAVRVFRWEPREA